MEMDKYIDKCMKNTIMTKKLFSLFRMLKNECGFYYEIDFTDHSRNDLYIVNDFVQLHPDINKFILLCDFDMINCDFTDWVIVRYGFGKIVEENIFKMSNRVGFKCELMDNYKMKLTLNTK